jgi:hypothetical protein
MHRHEHSTFREGLATGLLGAVVTAVWYLLWDFAAGRPLHTFNVLGRILLQGDVNPGARALDAGAIAGYSLLHLVVFVLIGIGLTLLAHLAARNPVLRMGVWFALVISFLLTSGLVFMLNTSTGDRLPLWEVLGAGLIGIGTMAWQLWRWHPALSRSVDEAPLGDEVRTPPHAPGRPRA